MPRLFAAIPLPDMLHDTIERLQRPIPGVRWLDPATWHITLRFIGEVTNRQVDDIADALGAIHLRPFPLRLQSVGHFPPRGQPKSLYAGVAPAEALSALKREVDRALRPLDLPADNRPFVPHVTLARLTGTPPDNRFAAFWRDGSLFRTEPFVVEQFALYSSHLRPGGAHYRLEAMYGRFHDVSDDEFVFDPEAEA